MPNRTQLRTNFRDQEAIYESIAAANEFERYIKLNPNNINTNTTNSIQVDCGFEISPRNGKGTVSATLDTKSPLMKHSTLNPKENNFKPTTTGEIYEIETLNLYEKILEKLSKSSIESPANIPILCVSSFCFNDATWMLLSTKFSSSGLNVRLIELAKGVPVNALFYLSNLDLIYVRTAYDTEGYVPRECCRPIGGSSFQLSPTNTVHSFNYSNTTGSDELKFNPSQNPPLLPARAINYTYGSNEEQVLMDEKKLNDESIKYHSIWVDSENYENLVDEKCKKMSDFYSIGTDESNNQHTESSTHSNDYMKLTRDSGYKSEIDNQTQFSSSTYYKLLDEVPPAKQIEDKYLMNMQSRSRLPISIRSNLNLTLIDAPQQFSNGDSKNMSEFKRNHIRRSLDSSIANGGYANNNSNNKGAFYAVSIELDEQCKSESEAKANSNNPIDNLYPDLDVDKIELDSLDLNNQPNQSHNMDVKLDENKVWTVVLKHEARNFQELTVLPGMFVQVIKQFSDLMYVKLIGFNDQQTPQFGLIPKQCAINLHEFINGSTNGSFHSTCQTTTTTDLLVNNFDLQYKRRKSQIKAL